MCVRIILYIYYIYYMFFYYIYLSSKYIKITFPDVPGTLMPSSPSQRLRYRFLPIRPRIDTLQALLRGVQLRAQLLLPAPRLVRKTLKVTLW